MSRPPAPRPRVPRPASPSTPRPAAPRTAATASRTPPTAPRVQTPHLTTPVAPQPAPHRGVPASRPPARAAQPRPAPRGVPATRSAPATPRTGADLRPPSASIGGAPRWVSGLLAGAQAALLSVVVVVMPALAAYVATSADPANADVGWTQSVAVGAVIWLLGHGAVVQAGGATLTFVPLGITLLAVFVAFASARRSAHPTRSAWLAGIGAYLGVVAVVVVVLGQGGPLGAGPWAVARALLGAGVVAAAGLGLGLLRPGVLRDVTAPVWSRLSPLVRAATTAGVMVVSVLVASAALVTVGWVVAGRAAAGDVIDGLGLDTFSGALLALAQLAVVPNLVLWALAWIVGPGFSVGAGTLYSPAEVIGGPLPALPILGALPTDGAPGAAAEWAPLLVVAAGAVAGWWLHRRVTSRSGWEPFAVATGAALCAGLCAGLLSLLAAGSVGPGRLAQVGGPAWSIAVTVAGLSLVGALLAAVPTDPVVRERFAGGCRTIWRRLRGGATAQR